MYIASLETVSRECVEQLLETVGINLSHLIFKLGNMSKVHLRMMFDVGMDAFPFVCYSYCQLQKGMGQWGIAWIGQKVRWIGVLGFQEQCKIGRWSKWTLRFTYFMDLKFSVMKCIWLYLLAKVFRSNFIIRSCQVLGFIGRWSEWMLLPCFMDHKFSVMIKDYLLAKVWVQILV